ncbi:D-inositol-3-phosphate glycosyltransferase [compost metagenome]
MVEHEVTGLLTSAGDVDALANSLRMLLKDNEYRTKLGVAAQQWGLKHWSMDGMMEKLLDQYHTAILKRRQG